MSTTEEQNAEGPLVPRSKKFTLDRRRAREIEDFALAEKMSEWLSIQTGIACTSDRLCSLIEDGVVLCVLMKKFGQTTRFWDPPKNEFQRRENIALFARACSRLNLSSEPIPNRRGLIPKDFLPCLTELAVLAMRHAKSMRRVVAGLPLDGNVELAENGADDLGAADSPEYGLFTTNAKNAKNIDIKLVPGSLQNITWGGAKVLLQDILVFQRSRFQHPDHQILCLGAGVTLCGIWAAISGSDVVLTESLDSIDLVWTNVALNADDIRVAGGSCGVRALSFKNVPADIGMVLGEMSVNGELTVLASDKDFSASDLVQLATAVCEARPDAKFYIVVHHDHVFHEFFQQMKKSIDFVQVFGDMEYRIIRGEIGK